MQLRTGWGLALELDRVQAQPRVRDRLAPLVSKRQEPVQDRPGRLGLPPPDEPKACHRLGGVQDAGMRVGCAAEALTDVVDWPSLQAAGPAKRFKREPLDLGCSP